MDKLHKSMNNYVKSVQKRSDTEDREKHLPVGYLGSAMISHGQDFQPDSEFGNCLISKLMRY
jgi:BAR domain